MFLLNNLVELKKYAIILCDNKQILDTLTYEEMIDISEKLKNELANSINDENICVGLLMDHNLYVPSIILSLQKLKHTFVFLTSRDIDKNYLKLQWILSFEDFHEIPLFYEVKRLTMKDKSLIMWNHHARVSTNLNFQNVFCIVQTSGSTGDSKLIRVTNTCIETNASNLRKLFDLKYEDVIFWGTNLTFDPSIIELIVALQSGASLVIVPHRVYINPNTLYETLFTVANITFLQVVPSVFLRWNEDQIKKILLNTQLRVLAFGGEHFPKNVLSYERGNNLRIFNLYGISEVSCWATLHEITNESHNDDIPIGQTLDGTVLELRDAFGATTNCGVGEIFIGSSTRICYINEESLTGSGIVFRETGDLAEVRDDRIFLVGRKNKIIKRFGHRIDLTKMENKIFQETGLNNVCIWSQKNTKLLTFVLVKNLNLDIKEKFLDKLHIKLINILSGETFPDFIDIVTHFPLTCHGKINEKALEKLYSISEIAESYENTFSLLWCKYIGISTDNLPQLRHYTFFDMGGNSISAIQLLTEFKEITKCEYPNELVTMIFESCFGDCLSYLKGIRSPKKNSDDNKTLEDRPTKKRKTEEGDLKILWSYDLKACVDSSPLVFQKENVTYVAIGSFSHKFVVFRDDGQVIYEIHLPDSIECTPSLSPCGNFILVGCFNGIMYCIDFAKKKIMWGFATNSKIKSSASFCREETATVFGSYDKTIYCVSITDGLKLWGTSLYGSISADPMYSVSKKNIYTATTKGTSFCLNEENGQIIWRKSCSGPIFGTPCLTNSDENIIFPTVQGILHCLQTKTGQMLWKYQADGHIFSSLVSHENHISFGCFDKCVYLLNISDSKCVLIKKVTVASEISSTPFIYTVNENKVILTACNSGTINVIDFSTFELLHSVQLPGEVFSSPFVHNNKIFVGCRDNRLYCMQLLNK